MLKIRVIYYTANLPMYAAILHKPLSDLARVESRWSKHSLITIDLCLIQIDSAAAPLCGVADEIEGRSHTSPRPLSPLRSLRPAQQEDRETTARRWQQQAHDEPASRVACPRGPQKRQQRPGPHTLPAIVDQASPVDLPHGPRSTSPGQAMTPVPSHQLKFSIHREANPQTKGGQV